MNKIDKKILFHLEELLDTFQKTKKEKFLKRLGNIDQKVDYEIEALEETSVILQEIMNVLRGNKTKRIISPNVGFSSIIISNDLSNEQKKYITMKVIKEDIDNVEKLLNKKCYSFSQKQKDTMLKHNITQKRFFQLLELSEEERKKLPLEIQTLILESEQTKKEILQLKDILFTIRDHYFKKQEQFTYRDYLFVRYSFIMLQFGDNLFDLLCEELRKEIAPITPAQETLKDTDEPPLSSIPNELPNTSRTSYQDSEKERKGILQEIRNVYNLTKDKPVRSLKTREQATLVQNLENLGYSEMECKRIIQRVNKIYYSREEFGRLDYLEKIELAQLLRIIFYSDIQIKAVLKRIGTGLIVNRVPSTKKEKERNEEVYHVFMKFLNEHEDNFEIKDAYQESDHAKRKMEEKKSIARKKLASAESTLPEQNDVTNRSIMSAAIQYRNICKNKGIYSEIKQLLNEARTYKKEKLEWDQLARELLEKAYKQSDFQGELESSNQRLKKIS